MIQVTLPNIVGAEGIFTDGDWIESKDQDPGGDVRLLQLADIGEGSYINKSDRYLTSAKAAELKCTYIQSGDVLIARMPDPLGRACIFPGDMKPCVVAVDICIVRPDPKLVDRRWLQYRINSPEFRLKIDAFATGTTRKRISRSNLSKIDFELPPLEHQIFIADVLDKADALRKKRLAALAKLDDLLKSVFLDMFGDPVTNPKGWKTAKLEKVANILTGFAFKSSKYLGDAKGGVKLCRGINVEPGSLRWADTAYWSSLDIEKYEKFLLRENDVILAMDRPWISSGLKVAMAGGSDVPSFLVQRVSRIRALPPLTNSFVYHSIQHPAFTRHCNPTETTVPHISPKDIKNYPIFITSEATQSKFSVLVQRIENEKALGLLSLKKLDKMFNSLQQRAFKGELLPADAAELENLAV